MPSRTRLYDVRFSELPQALGYCQGDIPRIAAATNTAMRRLLYCKEAGPEGWWGSFAEIAFNVSRTSPYITFPREVARVEAVSVCERPVPVHSQFFEYLQFGNGRLPKTWRGCRPNLVQAVSRNNAVTFQDLTSPPQFLAAYLVDQADFGKRVFFQGEDQTGAPINGLDNGQPVKGVFVTLAVVSPAMTPFPFSKLTGIQKDVTFGQVQIFQIDPATGNQVLLLTMDPGETTASYRRYYFDHLPATCCPQSPAVPNPQGLVQVTAMVKLDLIPVISDTDYCLLQNIEAITEEAQSARYSKMDSADAARLSQVHHINAVRFLNGELDHYLGKNSPAVGFAPFGSANLERQRIGTLI
jgi:hypothetical protein